MIFYLVRHGEIESNIKKVYAGWSEEELTEKGVLQAEEAGKSLRDKEIDRLYCSPLKRAVQTAEIIGGIIGKEPIPDANFKEIKLGPWVGLSEDEGARRFPEEWALWNERPAELRLDGRETLEGLQERVLEGVFSRRLTQMDTDLGIVVVTHVAIIRVLLLYSEGRELNEYKKVAVGNGEVFELADKLVGKGKSYLLMVIRGTDK